jgi:D-serine deaminase-like pyridoxal phosphate-dependent protein
VYYDTSSLEELEGFGFVPAVSVLATVISHPRPNIATCDAGHKSVSVDAGVPNSQVIGWPNLKPLKPSEEHLPMESSDGLLPGLGEKLYLIPRHVCPTVNNFDQAVFVRDGLIEGLEPVTARGHENPLVMAEQALSV